MVVVILFFPKFLGAKDPWHARQVGYVESPAVTESSGMAASRRDPSVLWTLNDSGHPAVLHALSRDGEDLGRLSVSGARNRDWEDLAAFRLAERPYLLIGDVGDNGGRYRHCTLYAVLEPGLTDGRLPAGATAPVAWSIRFVYADGPRDCEAVAVDETAEQVLLLSKRDVPPRLYSLPLRATAGGETVTARPILTLGGIPPPSPADLRSDPRYGKYAAQPTAMDVAPDGSAAAVLTYKRVYLFERSGDEPWTSAFSRKPARLPLPLLPQAEGICFAGDARTLFVTSEKRRPPLIRIHR